MNNEYLIGDNLELLKATPNESVQLAYMDPPYATGRDFGDFVDKFESTESFAVDFLMPRFVECHRILKKDGNIVVHIEPKISHYVRLVLDGVFGERAFRNEIVWKSGGNKNSKKQMARFHDTILVYGKGSTPLYNPLYLPYGDEYKKALKLCDVTGKYYSTSAAHCSQTGVINRPKLQYKWNGHDKQWYCSEKKMRARHDAGALEYNKRGIPRFKKYIDDLPGVSIRDLWTDINQIQSWEKMDYATQKPVKLLERIIEMYSNSDDVVLDPFAGSGTTGRACSNLNRDYILFDMNQKGKDLFIDTLEKLKNKQREQEVEEEKDVSKVEQKAQELEQKAQELEQENKKSENEKKHLENVGLTYR